MKKECSLAMILNAQNDRVVTGYKCVLIYGFNNILECDETLYSEVHISGLCTLLVRVAINAHSSQPQEDAYISISTLPFPSISPRSTHLPQIGFCYTVRYHVWWQCPLLQASNLAQYIWWGETYRWDDAMRRLYMFNLTCIQAEGIDDTSPQTTMNCIDILVNVEVLEEKRQQFEITLHFDH